MWPALLLLTPGEWSAVGVSLGVSLAATIVILVPGVLLGAWLARTRSPLRPIAETASVIPLTLPPVATGFILLAMITSLDLGILFTWWAAVLAAAVVSFPLLVRTVRSAVEQIDPRLTLAARTLGASRFRALRTITLPLAWRGIVGGATLAWARALGEFGATVILAGNVPGRTATIPVSIWTAYQTGRSPWRLIIAAIVLSALAMLASEWFIRKGSSRSHHASR